MDMDLQGFQAHQTEHYVFHYRPDTVAAKDIGQIVKEQESCYARITEALQVRPDFPLHYVLVEHAAEVGVLYQAHCGVEIGPINGFAAAPDTVVAVYNDDVKCIGMHEDTHLIAALVGDPWEGFLCEGLAMYMDAIWWSEPNELWVRRFLDDGRYIQPSRLLDNNCFYAAPCEVTYPIAGAFTRYLIEMLTMPVFLREIYVASDDVDTCLQKLLNKPIHVVEAEFIAWVSSK